MTRRPLEKDRRQKPSALLTGSDVKSSPNISALTEKNILKQKRQHAHQPASCRPLKPIHQKQSEGATSTVVGGPSQLCKKDASISCNGVDRCIIVAQVRQGLS